MIDTDNVIVSGPRTGDARRRLRPVLGRIKRGLIAIVPIAWRVHLTQSPVRLRLALRKKAIGAQTFIDRSVQVLGWDHVSIGHHSAISEGCWLNVNQRTPGHRHIVIGNHVYLGRRNFLTSGWQIDVGDYCMTGIDCKLMSGDHTFDTPLVPYMINGVTNDKTIRLGVNARLGAGVMVVGNVTIGHGSIVGAGALVNRDIPPFSIAIGVPCRVHKRFDFITNAWIDAGTWRPELDAAMPDENSYRTMLQNAFPWVHIPLQAASRAFGDMP
jgi:acetyltransferase-like isoleucine patch superfamily enzyme